MENRDLNKVNNILRSSTTSSLTVGESNNSPTFTTEKDYYDFVLSILIARKSTNSIMTQFYKVASINNITYENNYELKADIIGILSGKSK
jgi:hypothetical protein